MKKWKLFLGVFLLFIIISGSVLGINIYSKYKDALLKMYVAEEEKEAQKTKHMDPFALLLFGISERREINDFGRSDTIMLALVDPQKLKVQLISIPRDTYVDIPGYRKDKINAAFPRGGANLLKKTLENWLDLEIKGYVSVNFQGFIDVVDLVGGLDIYVPRNMRYTDPTDGTNINLREGQKVLDGKNTLDYVRFRKSNDGRHGSDYERMERQQQALKILGSKLLSLQSMSKYYEILNIVSANIKTTLTVEEMDYLIKRFINFEMSDLGTTSIVGYGYYENKAWYERISEQEMARVKDLLRKFFIEEEKDKIAKK